MPDQARPPAVDERVGIDPAWDFGLALRSCVDCGPYHALRPYLRASGTASGVTHDWSGMEPAVARLIAEGRRRVLITGAGDTGIAALVLTAARGRPIHLTVIDRCATPLVQIQRLAARNGFTVSTRQDDLTTFDLPDAFDLVVGHHVLQFLPPGGPAALLRRAANALAPGGRLLMVTRERAWKRVRDRLHSAAGQSGEAAYIDEVLGSMASKGLSPPAGQVSRFEAFLQAAARLRVQRAEHYGSGEEFEALLTANGFLLESSVETGRLRPEFAALPGAERPRVGVIAVARPRRHDAP